jgi:transposase
MSKSTRYVGLDVHAASIAVAVAEASGEVRSLGTIPNRPESVRRLVKKLGPVDELRACYEAGPTGYALYWELSKLGVRCDVVAPTLVPQRVGERIKTDRRDAEKLARCHRAGDLTAVWVPDAAHEALRDVVRAREAAKKDELRAKHRLSKYLLRNGWRPSQGAGAWSNAWWHWVRALKPPYQAQRDTLGDYIHEVEHAQQRIERLERAIDEALQHAPSELKAVVDALQALRGVAKLTATTLAVEVGDFTRFSRPSELMGYTGMVPSEHSSGPRQRRGAITKTGNSHLRRVLVESAWQYRHQPRLCVRQKRNHRELSEPIKEIAWKAQHRLHKRYRRLSGRGKPHGKVITAVARELVGFIWAVAVQAQAEAAAK